MITVQSIAQVAAGCNVSVLLIEHSGKTRARQTVEIMVSRLTTDGGVVRSNGLGTNDDVIALAECCADLDNVTFAGHLPFMERLVSCVITRRPDLTVVFKGVLSLS